MNTYKSTDLGLGALINSMWLLDLPVAPENRLAFDSVTLFSAEFLRPLNTLKEGVAYECIRLELKTETHLKETFYKTQFHNEYKK
jgi:hypothetical protein